MLGAAPGAPGTAESRAASPGSAAPAVAGSRAAATGGPAAPAASAAPAPREEAEPPRFAWPRLRVIEHVEANEIVEAGGVPVALRAVRVKERLPELVQRFADAFRDGGLYVPPGKEQSQFASGAVMLTGVDARRRVTYTAIMQPQDDGTTTLYLGEANHALRREPLATGDFAPLPPGASQVLRVGGESARTLAFHVPLSGADVDAFYARALAQHGWRRAEEEPGFFTRSGEELRVVHEPGAGGLRAVVLVYRTGRSAPGVPPPAGRP
nr:hypothetical protein [Myxococcus sp. RHSTA-1-4]